MNPLLRKAALFAMPLCLAAATLLMPAQAHEGHELRTRRRLRFQFTALLEPSKVAGYQRRFR